jgi:hypothetical protein
MRLVEHGDQGVDRRGVGGVDLGRRRRRGHDVRGHRRRLGHLNGLDVGGVPARVASHERVLAVGVDREELLGGRAAHRAGHRLHDDVVEAEPVEDADVRRAVGVVAGLQPRVVDVEAVGVLHDELAAAQETGARAGLVAVLRLDLVERERQVLVGGVQVLDREREHLLVRGAEEHVGVLAVLQPEQVGAVVGPAAGRLVGLPRQQRREEQLLGADRVHLLAHDHLDLAQHPQPQRQPGVDARRGAADVPGAHQQPVARQLGVGRVLAQGPQEQASRTGARTVTAARRR